MTRLDVFSQRAPTRIVKLAHPIEVDGELLTHVEARAPIRTELDDLRAGRLSQDEIVAICTDIPLSDCHLISDLDHARLAEVMGSLSAEIVQMVLDARRAAFRVIEGGAA